MLEPRHFDSKGNDLYGRLWANMNDSMYYYINEVTGEQRPRDKKGGG